MESTSGVWVGDPYATVTYGRHHGLLLIDGAGRPQLETALDPRPKLGILAFDPGDPFEDRSRPLHLALAGDCVALPAPVLRALGTLGRLPGVTVDVMPGLPTFEGDCEQVGWSANGEAVTTTRRPNTQWAGLPQQGFEDFVAARLSVDRASAFRITRELAAFDALGYDYLVSPQLAAFRASPDHQWLRDDGLATAAEALRLAGTKARMSGMLRIQHDSDAAILTTPGRIYDMAVLRWVPSLGPAIAGAVGNEAEPLAATVPFLLGVRARLNQLLLARDEIYRLTRMESRARPRGPSTRERPARSGNELTTSLAYHLTAALDAAHSIGDGLAHIAATIDAYPGPASEISYGRLHRGGKDWEGAASRQMRHGLAGASREPFLRATRELRNRHSHREAVDYGRVEFRPPITWMAPFSVVWVTEETFGGRSDRDAMFVEFVNRANYSDGELAVLSFSRLVDEVWCASSEVAERALHAIKWGDSSWVRANPSWKSDSAVRRGRARVTEPE